MKNKIVVKCMDCKKKIKTDEQLMKCFDSNHVIQTSGFYAIKADGEKVVLFEEPKPLGRVMNTSKKGGKVKVKLGD